MDDVALAKARIIERCLSRVAEVHGGDDASLTTDLTKQDSIVLNLQRACEAAIDGAMRLVRVHGLGVPQSSRDAFDLLSAKGLLDGGLADRMKRMVGFRNIAIHDYERLDPAILRSIVRERLGDLGDFAVFLVDQAGIPAG